jgi:putative endonuclease
VETAAVDFGKRELSTPGAKPMFRRIWTHIARRSSAILGAVSDRSHTARQAPTAADSPRRAAASSLGADGERLAARFLERLGYRILARGHRQKLGEVDLIALDGSTIVFVEVKTWRRGQAGDPSEAVDARKQDRLTRAALTFLKERKLLEQPARFDVVSIVWSGGDAPPEIRHFINAFEAVGKWQMYR